MGEEKCNTVANCTICAGGVRYRVTTTKPHPTPLQTRKMPALGDQSLALAQKWALKAKRGNSCAQGNLERGKFFPL